MADPLGTILSVWAHPDDETYLCGALMARAVRNGSRVVCVTATRGELGSPDEQRWPSGKPLADVRTKELEAALAVLGVTEHHWLDYPDGGCAAVDQDEAIGRVAELMAEVRPDTVLTFGPDGMTGHDDHISVSPMDDARRSARSRQGRCDAALRDEHPDVAGAVPRATGRPQRVHGRRAAVHARGRAVHRRDLHRRAARHQAAARSER